MQVRLLRCVLALVAETDGLEAGRLLQLAVGAELLLRGLDDVRVRVDVVRLEELLLLLLGELQIAVRLL